MKQMDLIVFSIILYTQMNIMFLNGHYLRQVILLGCWTEFFKDTYIKMKCAFPLMLH